MKRFGAVVAACSGTSATTAADAWPVYEAEGSSIAVPETWLATSHDPAASRSPSWRRSTPPAGSSRSSPGAEAPAFEFAALANDPPQRGAVYVLIRDETVYDLNVALGAADHETLDVAGAIAESSTLVGTNSRRRRHGARHAALQHCRLGLLPRRRR